MEYFSIDTPALRLPRIALGCWGFAGGRQWGDQERSLSVRTIQHAIDNGITLLDTAEGYGDGVSEQIVGAAIAGRRDRVVVATKVSPNHLAAADLIAACDRSLRNLGCDYIDLYQLHWPNPGATDYTEVAETLTRLVAAGKIRAVGVCNFGVPDLESVGDLPIVSNQLPYSLLWRAIEYQILPAAVERGHAVLCYSSLLHGLLSGAYHNADEFPVGRARTRHFAGTRAEARHGDPGHEALTFATIAEIRRLCAGAGVSMATAATLWPLHRLDRGAVLIGARNVAQVDEALAAAVAHSAGRPGAELWAALDAATEELKRVLGPAADMWAYPGRIATRAALGRPQA